jgi:glycosyltransferase involved in cell wall biosynthesis
VARTDSPEATPLVSIVIPCHAPSTQVNTCLEAIARLRATDFAFESIVVDDGGPEPLQGVIDRFRDRLTITLVEQQRRGPGPARNAGAARARGTYLAFIDSDCTPAPDWLEVLTRELRQDDQRLLGGRVENALTDNIYSEASERISNFVYAFNRTGLAHEPFFPTYNVALSAALFHSLGGFTDEIPSATAEDKEFCDRWRERGLALAHVPDAVVYHAHRLTFAHFVRQHYNYGRGIFVFRLMRRRRTHSAALIPEALPFYAQLVTSPLRQKPNRASWRLVALLAVSQAATAAGAVQSMLVSLIRPRATRQAEPAPDV